MASTRNKNTKIEYFLEKRMNSQQRNYNYFANSSYGRAYDEKLFALGSNPSKLPRETLSRNPIDTESQLFGIGSSNLEIEKSYVQPQQKTLSYVSYFDKIPLVMPDPMVIYSNQRAGFLP